MSSAFDELDLGQTIRGFAAGQKLFGRYTLVRILGRGGMGVVWLARDEKLEREVALKFLPELMVFDEQAVVDLKRETKKSQELRHHHIVSVYDFVSDDRSACIAMEYVDGATLSALKARKENNSLEVEEIRPWMEQLCDALSYAHEKAKVVHRDLKPANLMVNGRGELKVTDFGIARSVSDSMSMLTQARGTSGTLVYMSPQQIDGERATPADDVYSLGATIYELLTSKPPFYSGSIERQIHEKTAPSMVARRMELGLTGAEIPRNWEETVAQCLAKDPAQRPQSVAQVAQMLGLKASSYSTTPVIPPVPAVKPSVKSRKLAPIALATAVVALFGGAAGWYFALYAPRESARKAEEARLAEQSNRALEERKAAEHLANAKGSALIRTEPIGAVVTLGNQIQKSPATFNEVKVGNVPLKIEFDGYEPVERQIEIKENEIADLGTIKLARNRGDAEIKSSPDGVEFDLVDADGSHHSGKTPQTLTGLPTGAAKIAFKRPGTSDQIEQLQVLSNKTVSGTFTLTVPAPAPEPSASVVAALQPTTPAKPSLAAEPRKSFAGTWTGKVRGSTKTTIGGNLDPAHSGTQTWDKPLIITIDESEKAFRQPGGDYGTVSIKGSKATLQLAKERKPVLTKGQHFESTIIMTLQNDGKTASYELSIKTWKPHERTGAPVVVTSEMVGMLHKGK